MSNPLRSLEAALWTQAEDREQRWVVWVNREGRASKRYQISTASMLRVHRAQLALAGVPTHVVVRSNN